MLADPKHLSPTVALASPLGYPRVLFVGRSIGHFSYYQSILESLLAKGASVELVFDQQWSRSSVADQRVIDDFARKHSSLVVGWLPRRSDAMREFVFALRELRSFRSYLTRPETTEFYVKRWRQYLPTRLGAFAESETLRRWLAKPMADALMRLAERVVPPDLGILEFVDERRPDVVVVSPLNMRFSEETDYVKAARKLGIPTLLPVYSWDNLSTKGLIQVVPDRVFVWNDYQRADALVIQDIPEDRIRVGGAPFFDKWFEREEPSVSREAFFTALRLDPSRPLLLYLGSSRNIAVDETWFVEAVHNRLRRSGHDELRNTQILVRPHPAHAKIYHRLKLPNVRVWPREGGLPASPEELARMRDSFHYADAALGINTSGLIDSVLADLPTFSVRIPQYAGTQANTLHFRYLEEGGAMGVVDGLTGFTSEFRALLAGDDRRKEQRRVFAERFARPHGLTKSAGEVVAEGIIALANGGVPGQRSKR